MADSNLDQTPAEFIIRWASHFRAKRKKEQVEQRGANSPENSLTPENLDQIREAVEEKFGSKTKKGSD
jgi:hypothetical protein